MFFGMNALAARVNKAIDWANPIVGAFARQLAGAGEYNTSRICSLAEGLTARYDYLADPVSFTKDIIPSASQMIQTGLYGDCEEKAVLTAACIRSLGGSPRIVFARTVNNGRPSAHAYCEVFAGDEYRVRESVLPTIARLFPRAGAVHCHFDPAGALWISMDTAGESWPGAWMTPSDIEIASYLGGGIDKLDESGGEINLNRFLPESNMSHVRPFEVFGSDPALAVKMQDPMPCDPSNPLRKYLSVAGLGLWVPNLLETQRLRYLITYQRQTLAAAYKYAQITSIEPPKTLTACITSALRYKTGDMDNKPPCAKFKACLFGYILNNWLKAPEPETIPAEPPPEPPPIIPIHDHAPPEAGKIGATNLVWIGLALYALTRL